MDYKQLQFFLAVCEAQSFRNAAARCYVSQQAISKSLSNLEQELGVQLFVRNQNGVSLTEAGQQLEKLARPHLNQRDEILRQMRSFHSKQQLHIGYFMGFLQELPPHFFPQFQEFHPEVQLHYHSYTDTEHSRCYRNYDCDLVITTSPLISSDFIELAHSESSIGVILSCDHSLAKKNVLTTEDLKTVPLITLNTENRSQTRLLECLQAKGLTIDSVLGDADGELASDLLQKALWPKMSVFGLCRTCSSNGNFSFMANAATVSPPCSVNSFSRFCPQFLPIEQPAPPAESIPCGRRFCFIHFPVPPGPESRTPAAVPPPHH